MSRTALICGITGQDGVLLARLLLNKGYRVHGMARDLTSKNLAALRQWSQTPSLCLHALSICHQGKLADLVRAVQPNEVYNLAGQSSVGLSFEEPVGTYESVVLGAVYLVEAVRKHAPSARIFHASSGDVFGDCPAEGATESTPMQPVSPYGVAKATLAMVSKNARETLGVHSCTAYLFNHESLYRPAHFVTCQIIQKACQVARGEAREVMVGNVDVVRDWGWAEEYVEAMWLMLQQDVPDDYVIATGKGTRLVSMIQFIFDRLGLNIHKHLKSKQDLSRPMDLMYSVGCPTKAAQCLGWVAQIDMYGVVDRMLSAQLAMHAP